MSWKFYPEALSLFNYGLDSHLFMNLFTKVIPIEDYMAYFNCFRKYGSKYFPTINNKFHVTTLKVTAMDTSVAMNSGSLFLV